MTLTQRDAAIDAVKRKDLPLPLKAKEISEILSAYNSPTNPDPVYFNQIGIGLTRALTREERIIFETN